MERLYAAATGDGPRGPAPLLRCQGQHRLSQELGVRQPDAAGPEAEAQVEEFLAGAVQGAAQQVPRQEPVPPQDRGDGFFFQCFGSACFCPTQIRMTIFARVRIRMKNNADPKHCFISNVSVLESDLIFQSV